MDDNDGRVDLFDNNQGKIYFRPRHSHLRIWCLYFLDYLSWRIKFAQLALITALAMAEVKAAEGILAQCSRPDAT